MLHTELENRERILQKYCASSKKELQAFVPQMKERSIDVLGLEKQLEGKVTYWTFKYCLYNCAPNAEIQEWNQKLLQGKELSISGITVCTCVCMHACVHDCV